MRTAPQLVLAILMNWVLLSGQIGVAQQSGDQSGKSAQEKTSIGEQNSVDAGTRESFLHGNAFYQAGNSALDASPYALQGIPVAKPSYGENSFGATLDGVLPWWKKGTTSLSASYSGQRSANPYSGFATVPNVALRAGDFSGLQVPFGTAAGQSAIIYDPATGQPFANNRIPLSRMSPTALALLGYMPLPTRPGLSQNFGFTTGLRSSSDGFALSLSRLPSTEPVRDEPLRQAFRAGLAYRRSASNLANVFPLLGGDTTAHGWSANLEYTLSRGFFTSDLRLGFESNRSLTQNRFRNDVASLLGITGVSRDPFDWGLPSISFALFRGLHDVAPALRMDRNANLGEALSWNRGKHNLKWGGEFRRLGFDLRSDQDATGSFVFTGFATARLVDGVPVPGTGSDFADFLLGLPQKTHLQYSSGPFSFHGNVWSLYLVDDWRLANDLTLNLGVRYEYVSPLSEAQNRLATLDAPPDFSAVVPVLAGAVGPFSGPYPSTIVEPDRNNFAPRIGVAWRAAPRLTVRAGYSISYDSSVYNALAPQLSAQPPFAVGQTGIATAGQALTLTNGFPSLQPEAVANDFAVSRILPLAYAQVWLLEVQNELPGGFVLVTSYTGTKGTHLPMRRAPNRTAAGLLLPGVAPFLWETDDGSSILHAGSARLQKRLAQGLSFDVSYTFSRSIDDVPALGDEAQVAQDDLHPSRDRGLSAFDQRHRMDIDYSYELPFGRGKPWLGASSLASRVLGNWSLTGSIRYGSGYPLTPHALGSFADVATGGYGALRPDSTGQPIALPQPTVARFFNTGAFMPPPIGQYGNAGRNVIIGPAAFGMDAALQKSFPLPKDQAIQFYAQASNLLNTPVFTRVDTSINSASYGQITGAGNMRSIKLGLRYFF